jgi:hypothetical protein
VALGRRRQAQARRERARQQRRVEAAVGKGLRGLGQQLLLLRRLVRLLLRAAGLVGGLLLLLLLPADVVRLLERGEPARARWRQAVAARRRRPVAPPLCGGPARERWSKPHLRFLAADCCILCRVRSDRPKTL